MWKDKLDSSSKKLAALLRVLIQELKYSLSAANEVRMYMFIRLVRHFVLTYKERIIMDMMKKVKDFKSWERLAKLLDQVTGALEWKLKFESSTYDYQRIQNRYELMRDMRHSDDIEGLINSLR